MKLNKTDRKISIMGILNVTPDSFSDGGVYFDNNNAAVTRAIEMINEGADIIDIGGESSRPGSNKTNLHEELRRILPVIDEVRKNLKENLISVDTNKADVAEEAVKKGASIINSLGGFLFDKKLAGVAAKYKCKVIIYHIKGVPKTMQINEIIYKDIVEDISKFFLKQIDQGLKSGMKRDQFIIDPGIGFGKTVQQNIEIIKRLDEFKKFQLPIAVGISRKSHLGALLAKNIGIKEIPGTNERLEGGLAETAIAVLNGAEIVRTHDVGATKRFLSVLEEFVI